MREETKTKKVTVYVAEDGKEFFEKSDCMEYEAEVKRKKEIAAVEKLRIDFPLLPPCINLHMDMHHVFTWYRLENEDDYGALNKVLRHSYHYNDNEIISPAKYPEIMCVETFGSREYDPRFEVRNYTLSECMDMTKRYWRILGYDVTIHKSNKKVITKAELREKLLEGVAFIDLFDFIYRPGSITYKRENFEVSDNIIYIPDVCMLRNIDLESRLDDTQIEKVIAYCYDGNDFVEMCKGNENLARELFDSASEKPIQVV